MSQKTKRRPGIFRALGKNEPAETIRIGQTEYQLLEVYKHDSWAATSLYGHGDEHIVCKFNRQQSIFGIPTAWLGKILASREAFAMQLLEENSQVPNDLGPVLVHEQVIPTAVAHNFIPGHPLEKKEIVDDHFFPELLAIVKDVHQKQLAYVDLHKRENILVGEDGSPHLIDFQISFCQVADKAWVLPTTRMLLSVLQYSDLYHLTKHVKAHRPDQVEELGLTRYATLPWWIRIHRLFAVPFRYTRRRLLSWIKVRDKRGRVYSEEFAEHAFREKKKSA